MHIPPLKNLQFYVWNNDEEVKKRILRLGGLVLSKGNVAATTAAVIATKKEVYKWIKSGANNNANFTIVNNDIEVWQGTLPQTLRSNFI